MQYDHKESGCIMIRLGVERVKDWDDMEWIGGKKVRKQENWSLSFEEQVKDHIIQQISR